MPGYSNSFFVSVLPVLFSHWRVSRKFLYSGRSIRFMISWQLFSTSELECWWVISVKSASSIDVSRCFFIILIKNNNFEFLCGCRNWQRCNFGSLLCSTISGFLFHQARILTGRKRKEIRLMFMFRRSSNLKLYKTTGLSILKISPLIFSCQKRFSFEIDSLHVWSNFFGPYRRN